MPFAGYNNFNDCVNKNQDKENPEAYCGSIQHKVEEKLLAITEKVQGRIVASESINVSEKTPEKIIVQGLLLPKDQVSRNGVLYDWDSIKAIHKDLIGRPMLYNHLNESDKPPIGKYIDSWVEEKGEAPGWYYKADVNPKSEYADSILRGDLDKVSIQVIASQSKQERNETDEVYTRAFIGDILEASVVPTPGFIATNIEVVLAEKFRTMQEAGQTTSTASQQTKGPQTYADETEETINNLIDKLSEEEASIILLDNQELDEEDSAEILTYIKKKQGGAITPTGAI